MNDTDLNLKKKFFDSSVQHWLNCGKDPHRRKFIGEILRRWYEYPSGKILDIGCGTGIASSVLVENGFPQEKIFMVDISTNMLLEAKKILPHSNVALAQGEKLPFRENSFERIILFDSLPHFEIDLLMSQVGKICSPRGEIIILHDNCHIGINRIHREIGEPVEDAVLPPIPVMAKLLWKQNFCVLKILEWEKKIYFIWAKKKPL